jgi:hypothetical protein
MENSPNVETQPTPEEVAEATLPPPLAHGDREVLEGRIAKLTDENATLRTRISELEFELQKAKATILPAPEYPKKKFIRTMFDA